MSDVCLSRSLAGYRSWLAGWRAAGELVDPEALAPGFSFHCRIGPSMPGFGHMANPLR